MAIDLSGYRAVWPVMFVRLDISGYQVLKFSDFNQSYTIGGDTYTNIGSLLNVSTSASEIRATESEVIVAISGIPPGSVTEILNNNPKGSNIIIRRGFFNPVNATLLPIAGNPAVKFNGMVTNYSMDETWDDATKTSSFTISLVCQSELSIMKTKVAGRRTNPYDEERFFPGDKGMNRVPTIVNSNFQFGAPPGSTVAGGAK